MIMLDTFGQAIIAPDIGEFEPPLTGDVFVVTTEGQDRGIVMIAATSDDPYVLAWVVTADTTRATFPAFRLDVSGMGPIAVWPESEFGLSSAALGRKVGHVLNSRTIHMLRLSPHEEELVAVVDFYQMDDSEAALENLSHVVSAAWELGEWRWPTDESGSLVLERGFAERVGISPKEIASHITAKPKRTAQILNGSVVPTKLELEQLSGLLPDHANGDMLPYLAPITASESLERTYPIYNGLSDPSFKESIQHIMKRHNLSEIESRNLVWQSSFGLAARQAETDPRKRTHDRIKQAISGILEEE